MVYLWRAVDAEGEVLDVLVQSKRNKHAALKLMRKLLRKYAVAPGQPERMKNGVGYVLSELIAGIGEVALLAGLTQIVSVFDARILRGS